MLLIVIYQQIGNLEEVNTFLETVCQDWIRKEQYEKIDY